MSAVMDSAAVRGWLAEFALLIDAQATELTELDAAIGDADHGTNMQRGTRAVVEALATLGPETAVGPLLKTTAMTLISKVGGASGPLYGTLFLRMSTAVGSAADLDGAAFAAAFRTGVEELAARGKAVLGEKTMYDALAPACDAIDAAVAGGIDLGTALDAAVIAAEQGRDSVTPLVARKGRASYLGERSANHQDPGATSAVLLVRAAATALAPSSDSADSSDQPDTHPQTDFAVDASTAKWDETGD